MTLTELAVACRTYRRFTQEEVPQELLALMVENARISNSALNQQPLRYVVVRDPELVAAMQPMLHWAAKLPKEIGTPKEGEQPTAFIVVCTEGRDTPYTGVDMGIAVRTMTLTACEGGVEAPPRALAGLPGPCERHHGPAGEREDRLLRQ